MIGQLAGSDLHEQIGSVFGKVVEILKRPATDALLCGAFSLPVIRRFAH